MDDYVSSETDHSWIWKNKKIYIHYTRKWRILIRNIFNKEFSNFKSKCNQSLDNYQTKFREQIMCIKYDQNHNRIEIIKS